MVWHYDYRVPQRYALPVTLLDAAGLEMEAWALDGYGRRVAEPRATDFSDPVDAK